MGIRYLQTFLCKDVRDGYFKVNIDQEINQWKKQNDGPVVIVFDVMGLLNMPLKSNLDVLLGGRHHIILNKYEEFFLTLKQKYEAELVFFCDGRVQQNKRDIWIERQNEKYSNTIDIFDKIEKAKGSLEFINNMKKDDFPGLTTMIYGLVNLCRKHENVEDYEKESYIAKAFGKALQNSWKGIRFTMIVECDTELSRFATNNNAVAVIADDTDFLIYEGNWKYWSARNLQFDELTTMEYSRSALRIALGLAQKQLSIFATLAGNDVIRQEYVEPFHKRLRLHQRNRFHTLAQFIRSNPKNINDAIGISYVIFGSTENQFVNLVRESLSTYDINYDITNEVDTLVQKSAYDTCFYTFLNGWPYNITLMFFDMRRTDFLSFYDIVMPIVKRQIGFVRQHKNETDYKQKIVTKVDHDQPYKEFSIAPEYPKIKLPDLLNITFNSKEEDLNPLRFEILSWLVFGCEKTRKIREIAINYMVVVTTLQFLLSISQITAMEADALLLCVHKVRQKTVPDDIVPSKVPTRSIIVSHLYARMHNTILTCFKFVGLEEFIDYLIFDGPYFAVLLKELITQTKDDYKNSIAEIQQYRQFLFD